MEIFETILLILIVVMVSQIYMYTHQIVKYMELL